MLIGLLAVVVGTVVAIGLGWLILSGVLSITFQKAREVVRQLADRRREQQIVEAERRANERRV